MKKWNIYQKQVILVPEQIYADTVGNPLERFSAFF